MPTIKLYSRRAGELPLMPCVPDDMKQDTLHGYSPLSSNHNGIRLLIQQYDAGSFLIRIIQVTASQGDLYTVMANPGIHLIFGLHRSTSFHVEGLNHQVFHDHGFNLLHIPQYSSLYELKPGTIFRFMAIRLSPQKLQDFVTAFDSLSDFWGFVARNVPIRFSPVNQIINAYIIMLLDDIQFAGERGRLNASYIESKVGTLINESLNILVKHSRKRSVRISESERNNIFHIKEMVLSNLHKHYTIEELSTKTGLTPYRIKKCFPIIYGMSVSDFCQEERLWRAKSLLENTMLSMEQVADQSGYANRKKLDDALQKSTGHTAVSYRTRLIHC